MATYHKILRRGSICCWWKNLDVLLIGRGFGGFNANIQFPDRKPGAVARKSAGRLGVSCYSRWAGSDVVQVCPIGPIPPVCLMRLPRCGKNGRLREANERLRVLLEDKDAKIADLEKRLARVERLFPELGQLRDAAGTDDLPGRTRRRRSPGAAAAASPASSAARRARTWNGTSTRTAPAMCSRPGTARAARTCPAPPTSASGTPTRSPTCPRPPRPRCSTTGTRWNAAAGGGMSRTRRRKRRARRAR